MNRAVGLVATACLLTAAAGRAQPPEPATLKGESAQTRKRLLEIEQKLGTANHADLADELQRLLDESAGDLVFGEGGQARPARWGAHRLLGQLQPNVLNAYQQRIDPPAQKLLARAKAARDPAPLYTLCDRYFVSKPAAEGLLLLGDLLFERGDFRAAEAAWRHLLPDAGADPVHPDPPADEALVRARIVLAIIFAKERSRAEVALKEFREKHPKAAGALAGRTGPLAETLKAFLDTPPTFAPELPSKSWSTFGGSPARAGRAEGGLPRAWLPQPWAADLPRPPGRFDTPQLPARAAFGHPVIANGEVFVADAAQVFRFDVRTGARGEPYPPNANRTFDACSSLTAADGLLYARFGPSTVRPPQPNTRDESFIYCLKPGEGKFTRLWRLAPPEGPKVSAVWEGAPLVVGKRMWAVYARFEGGRVVHVAAGYDPVTGEGEPQRPAWTTELCDAVTPAGGDARTRQELLTLAGRNVVFCSNSGAVVAVDAVTGQRAWAFRYPRARRLGTGGDPAPAVAFGGRVFVAPVDGERVYAFDAETGRLLWESGTVEGARILGVARNKLIVSTAGPLRSLRALALDTGSQRREDGGWVQPLSGPPTGRGLVSDDAILWPAREGLLSVDPDTGHRTPGRPNPLPAPSADHWFGNLAYADGVLIVVSQSKIWGHRAESRAIIPRPEWQPRELFEWLAARAERAFAAGDLGAAVADWSGIANSTLPAPLRAWAAARMLQFAARAPAREDLPVVLQDVLKPELLAEWVLDTDSVPITLEHLLSRHLGRAQPAGSVPEAARESRPDAPALTSAAKVVHEQKFPPGVFSIGELPGTGEAKFVFAAGDGRFVAIPLDRTPDRAFVAPDVLTHGASWEEGFVAAGPRVVALYGAAREPLWVFRVPTTPRLSAAPLPLRPDDGPPDDLSSFRLAGSWLVARLGHVHLIALDLTARRVAWVLSATGARGYEPHLFPGVPEFGAQFTIVGKVAAVQLSDGRRWFVGLESGRPIARPVGGERTALLAWTDGPTELPDGSLVLADGPATVRVVQFQPDERIKWTFQTRPDGTAGEPAQARAFGENVLISVRRNHGVELDLVNAADGQRAWAAPAFADADRVVLSATDADAARVYVPCGGKLCAFALASGKPLWAADLPSSTGVEWVARAGTGGVVVFPARAVPREPLPVVTGRLVRSFERAPQLWRLPGLGATLYDAWVDRAAPVLLLDPATGKALARFDLPARGPALAAHLSADVAVFVTADRIVWIK